MLWGMNRYQWTAFFAAWLGWGFDVFDGLLFNFVAPVCVPQLLGVVPGDPAGAALVTTVTGLVTSALLIGWATGGILFGWVTDRLGRARTLQLTILTYALATAACALAPDVWTLVVLRFIASLGIGGEWAAGASLVAEVVPPQRRVAAGALLYTSAPLGILLAGFVTDLLTQRIDVLAAQPGLAWRVVFLTGVLPAVFAAWIRRHVEEPEVWRRERTEHPRLAELFTPELRRATLGGLAMCLVTLLTWWATNAFLPFVAEHLAGEGGADTVARHKGRATALFTAGGFLGTVLTIPLAHLGRRPLFAIYLAGAALSIWLTFGLHWDPVTRTRLLFLDGLTVFGVVGAFSFYLPELFPTRLRGTGSGFCFNVGRYLAAAGPSAVGVALGSAATPMDAIRWVAFVPLAGLCLVPFIVETAPRTGTTWQAKALPSGTREA
jgi:MFS family permease